MNVKPGECAACPCGEIPERLCIVEQGGRWAMVAGACCGDWHVEFRTKYRAIGSPELTALALAAWNAAPRAPATKPCSCDRGD